MSSQSFDVSFYDKDLKWKSSPTWNATGEGTTMRGLQPKKDGLMRLDAKGLSHIDFGLEVGPPSPDRPFDRQRPERAAVSRECQVCTVAALTILVLLHILIMYELAAMIISIYFIVLTPLIGTFYNVSNATQVHLYVLHLSAVVILSVNIRYKRDFSFTILFITSIILSHVFFQGGSWKRKDDVVSLIAHRFRVVLVVVLILNVVGVYFLWERSTAKDYSPQQHGVQALLILLNLAVYVYSCT